MKTLLSLLTADQIASAKAGKVVWMSNAAHAKVVIKAGFELTKINARSYALEHSLAKELSSHLNAHGAGVKIISIDGKYSDNNGAYEVVTLADSEGNVFSVSNCYDSAVCFREMPESELLEYCNRQ